MKQVMMTLCVAGMFLFSSAAANAQLTTKKNDQEAQRRRIIEGYSAEFYAGNRIQYATPANVLKWATELNKELESRWAKFSKITPGNAKETAVKKAMEDAKTLCGQIIRKGSKLTAADAKKHDRVLFDAMGMMLNECLEANPGSECCFAWHNPSQGYAGMWHMVNCFTSRFPGLG